MLKRPVPPTSLALKALRSRLRNPEQDTDNPPENRHLFNLDELAASPWIGLHYKHEFLLHHSHHLLEQLPLVQR